MNEEARRIYRGLFLANFFITLGFGVADPFISVYAVSKGATGLHLALIFSGYAAAKALVAPLTGWRSDHGGRKSLILAGLCLYSAISLFYLTLPGPLALAGLRFLQGIAAAMVRPVSLAFVGDIAPERKEGTAMGTFDISFYGALAIGPVIGGILKDTAGFPGLFFFVAALCPLSFFTILFFVTGPLKGAKNRANPARRDFDLPGRRGMLSGLSVFIFTRSFGIALFAAFVPVYMCENLRLPSIDTGMVMGAATVVTALLLRPMGRLSDRVGRRRLVTAGGAMAALLTLCIPLAHGFWPLLAISAGIGVSGVVSLPASFALLVEEGNRNGMGLVMGIFNGAMNVAAVVAPLAGGAIFGSFGIGTIFYGAGIVGLSGVIFFAISTQIGEERHAFHRGRNRSPRQPGLFREDTINISPAPP
jgi:MFS family permease